MEFKIYKDKYYKNLPQEQPECGFVFTENAQVYLYMFPVAEKFSRIRPKTNVTCNRNQAGIRTNMYGKFYPNVFGICTKKFQQNEYGSFVYLEGCFKEEDENLFKTVIEHCIERIKNSGLRTIYFPESMALSKSSLTIDQAKYLKDRLTEEFGFYINIVPNNSLKCCGYGIRLHEKQPNYKSLFD